MSIKKNLLWALSFSGLALAAWPAAVRGDQVTLANGAVIKGKVTAEDKDFVTVTLDASTQAEGLSVTRKIARTKVSRLTRGAPTVAAGKGPGYVIIPIRGEIGRDTTAESVGAALVCPEVVQAKYVVFDIDSGGGSISEMDKIIDLVALTRKAGHEVVAYCGKAYSAAAILAMACPRVYIKPDGVIGAAVPIQLTPDGPVDVEAKFRSAFGAGERSVIQEAGHDGLFVRGMMETNVEIYLTEAEGKPVLAAKGPGKLIKARGEILTLTAREAIECGLATQATDIAEVGKLATANGAGWHETSTKPIEAAAREIELARRAERLDYQRQERAMAEFAAAAARDPRTSGYEHQLSKLRARAIGQAAALQDLERQKQADFHRADEAYARAVDAAKDSDDRDVAIARAEEVRERAKTEARRAVQATGAPLKAELAAAMAEGQEIRFKEAQILAKPLRTTGGRTATASASDR